MSGSTTVTLSTRIRKRVSGGNRIALLLLRRWDARIAIMILSLLTLSCWPTSNRHNGNSRRTAPAERHPSLRHR
jgi:hypothetical protein